MCVNIHLLCRCPSVARMIICCMKKFQFINAATACADVNATVMFRRGVARTIDGM